MCFFPSFFVRFPPVDTPLRNAPGLLLGYWFKLTYCHLMKLNSLSTITGPSLPIHQYRVTIPVINLSAEMMQFAVIVSNEVEFMLEELFRRG